MCGVRAGARREHVEDRRRRARAPARSACVRAVHLRRPRRRREREARRSLQRGHDRALVLHGDQAVLQNDRVQRQNDGRVAARRDGPVQRPDQRVAHHAAAVAIRRNVARPDVAHALRAHGDGALDRQRVAHRQDALAQLGVRHSRHQREARSRVGKRGCARRPFNVAHELAGRAVLRLQRLDLARSAVDAQRDEGVVERLALGPALRQRLELERHRAVVAADVLSVLLAKELAAVADQESLEEAVQVVERLPDVLVDLHAHRELAAALADHVRQREAVIRRLDRLDGERSALCAQKPKGRCAAARPTREIHRVDPPQLVVIRRLLDRDLALPLDRHRLDVAPHPRHGVCV